MSENTLEQVVQTLTRFATEYGLKIIGALLILIVGYTAAKILGRATTRALQKSKLDNALVRFLGSIVRFGIVIFAWIAALEAFGVKTTSFLAVLGAAGLAVGLALQGSLSNFASGVMILFLKPFDEKQYIAVAGQEGAVEEIGILTTTLRTLDNRKVIVPNSTVFSNTITNFDANPTRLVEVRFAVNYVENIDKVREAVLEGTRGHALAVSEPAPELQVIELGEYAVKMSARTWVKPEDYWSAYFGLHQLVKERLQAAGVRGGVPSRELYMMQDGK